MPTPLIRTSTQLRSRRSSSYYAANDQANSKTWTQMPPTEDCQQLTSPRPKACRPALDARFLSGRLEGNKFLTLRRLRWEAQNTWPTTTTGVRALPCYRWTPQGPKAGKTYCARLRHFLRPLRPRQPADMKATRGADSRRKHHHNLPASPPSLGSIPGSCAWPRLSKTTMR